MYVYRFFDKAAYVYTLFEN